MYDRSPQSEPIRPLHMLIALLAMAVPPLAIIFAIEQWGAFGPSGAAGCSCELRSRAHGYVCARLLGSMGLIWFHGGAGVNRQAPFPLQRSSDSGSLEYGNRSVIVNPPSCPCEACNVPPWAEIALRAIASPSPIPCVSPSPFTKGQTST